MSLLRKLTFILAATMATVTPLTVAPLAEAQSARPHQQQGHTQAYYVYYRSCPHMAWANYGGYYNSSHAAQAAYWFRSHGYEAFYR